MEMPKIKKSLFGYNVRDFKQYMKEQNHKQAMDIEKEKDGKTEIENLKQKIIMLETSIQSNNLINKIQKKETEEAWEQAKYWEMECKKWKEQCLEVNSSLEIGKYPYNSRYYKGIEMDKYKFSWELIGNIAKGRPTLGDTTRIEVYRLMQFTIRHVIVTEFGVEKTEAIFYQAGKIAGKAFYENMLMPEGDFSKYIDQLEKVLKEMGIGILEVEHADLENGELTLTVSEDLECSGLPNLDYEICTYDEGFIAALIESFTGLTFHVKEIDCWCTGHRTCRFHAVVEI
jgi:predicted hydrocarbon binding protein